MKRLLLVLLAFSVGAAVAGVAQKRTPAKPIAAGYKLTALKATGPKRYTEKEILAATGLQLGQNAAEGDFKEGAQRLGDSGMFSDVAYTFSYSDTGSKVEFQLADIDKTKLVPAHFENFVWFTDAELLAALKQRVPLFQDLVPLAGRLPDRISEALQALLSEKHYPGRVDFLREGQQEGGDFKSVVYKAEEVSIHIRNVEFPGASPEQAAFLASAASRLTDAEYIRSSLEAVARHDFVPLLLQRGYLKAFFGPSDARVVPSADNSTPTDIEVDALLPVSPGKQYMVSGVDWKGTSSLPKADVSSLFHLTAGQPADAVKLARDCERLTAVYRSRGYMTAQVKPGPLMDDDKGTVHYYINVIEGDIYKMGELEILGLDTPSHDRLREAWKLREDQPYNPEYTKKFLDDAGPLLPRGAQYSIKISEELDAKTKTVDVTIHYKMQ